MFDCLLKRYEADVLDPGLYETVKESFKKKNKEKNSIKSENSESLEGPESSESSEDSDNSKSWKTWKELQPYEKRVFIVGVIGAIFSIIFSFFFGVRGIMYIQIFFLEWLSLVLRLVHLSGIMCQKKNSECWKRDITMNTII